MESNLPTALDVPNSLVTAVIGDFFAKRLGASLTEQFESVVELDGVRIERIVSKGQTTPESRWYDQPWHEWVLVLAGAALLEIAGELQLRRLDVGQWCLLPAHCRHRVHWTDPEQETIWLAVHWGPNKQVEEE